MHFPLLMKCGFTLIRTLTEKTAETGALKTPTLSRGGPLPLLRIRGPLTENNWTHFVRRNSKSKMLFRTGTEFRICVGGCSKKWHIQQTQLC